MRNLFKLKNQENQRGVAAVEFAIVLPILAILLIGIIEFGIVLYNKQVVTNATREGVRAAINPDPKLDESQIKNIVVDSASDMLLSTLSVGDVTVTSSNNDFETREFPHNVIVNVTYEHNFLIPGFLGLGTSTNISSRTLMRMF